MLTARYGMWTSRIGKFALLASLATGCVLTPSHAKARDASMLEDVTFRLENPRRQTDRVRLRVHGDSGYRFAFFTGHDGGKATRLRLDMRECLKTDDVPTCGKRVAYDGEHFEGVFAKEADDLALEATIEPPIDLDAQWDDDWNGFVFLVRLEDQRPNDPFAVHVDVESTDFDHGAAEVAIGVDDAS